MSAATAPAFDRRRVPRIPFQRPARVRRQGRQWAVRVLDLSLAGAFVALPRSCRTLPGERLTLEIESAGQTLSVDCIVVRVRGKRVGVRAVAMRADSAAAIRALVTRELGQEDLAERSFAALS